MQKSLKRFLRNYILRYSELTWNINATGRIGYRWMTSQTDKSFTCCWKLKRMKKSEAVYWRQIQTEKHLLWAMTSRQFCVQNYGNIWKPNCLITNNIYWHAYNSSSLSSYDCFSKTVFFVVFTTNDNSDRFEGLFYSILLHIQLLILKVEIFYSCGGWHHSRLTLLPTLDEW